MTTSRLVDSVNDRTTSTRIKIVLVARFSDDRVKCRHRITEEICAPGNEKLLKIFCQRVKKAIDGGWHFDPNGTQAETDKKNKECIQFNVRGLKRNGIKAKAHESECKSRCFSDSCLFYRYYFYDQPKIPV